MRRPLLLLALCMALALVFAPMAIAQDDLNCDDLSEAEEQAVFDADPSDPNDLDEDDDGRPCEDDTSDNGSFVLPRDDGDDEDEADEDPYGVDEEQYDVSGSQYETETDPTTVSPSAELPETGGPSFVALALPTLLVAGGLVATRIVCR